MASLATADARGAEDGLVLPHFGSGQANRHGNIAQSTVGRLGILGGGHGVVLRRDLSSGRGKAGMPSNRRRPATDPESRPNRRAIAGSLAVPS